MNGMNEMSTKLKARADRMTSKRDAKKRQIAQSAIDALKHLGYANTTLRDIAAHSDLSLGMLHYYFEDRGTLIIYCVGIYKEAFVHDFRTALNDASGPEQVIEAFTQALVASIIDDDMTHRLWYDIRNQAFFDATFRPVVDEIETALIDIVSLALTKAGHAVPPNVAYHYALLDGAFRYAMQHQMGDTPKTRGELEDVFRRVLTQFL